MKTHFLQLKHLAAELGRLQTPKEKGLHLAETIKTNLWLVDFFRVMFEAPARFLEKSGVSIKTINKAIEKAGVAETPIKADTPPPVVYEVSQISGTLSEITSAPVPLVFGKLLIDGRIVGDLVLNRDFARDAYSAFKAIGVKVIMETPMVKTIPHKRADE